MIARWSVLVVVWVALWGEVSVANVASGVLVLIVLAVVFPPRSRTRHSPHPLHALALVWFVLSDLVRSSLNVVLAVLVPTPERTATAILPVQLTTRSPLVATIVANALTLTPGTMTVDADRMTFVLRVHVLGVVDPEQFHDEVLLLERRVIAAVGKDRAAR
jgi:multicomponent Na+:H+ antiporter subunit E